MSKNKAIGRRVIAFVGALIITFNIAAAPQRARAVAVTASVVASVAAIMAACGVTYWASTQQDAIDYLGGKIDAYLGSLETVPQSYEDWLSISGPSQLFDVTANGAMRFASGVANKILGFVRWFNQTEGVVSDGSAVSNAVPVTFTEGISDSHSGTVTAEILDAYRVRINLTDFVRGTSNIAYFVLNLGAVGNIGTSYIVRLNNLGVQWEDGVYRTVYVKMYAADSPSYLSPSYTYMSRADDFPTVRFTPTAESPCFCICLRQDSSQKKVSGYIDFLFSAPVLLTPPTAAVTPSGAVSVPEDFEDAQSFDVAPNVTLTQGMTVDQASDAVLGGVVSEEGLTAEGEAAEGAAVGWGWLADLLERIREAVQGTQEQTAPAQYEAIESYSLDLTSFFPFCIPWDLHRGLSLLVAEPVAPSINWTVPLPDGSTYTLALDLSDWDGVAQVARTMELLAFVVALAVATKKLIKW